ncbi:MAG: DUF11 domain-containing protein, partial [Anaerolineales bacterium]|nr:DUF11 domain-containing protein [Anaerolineales bacterium]
VGVNGQFGQRNLVLRNDNGQDMSIVWDAPTEDNDPTRIVAWGDYDGDGDLDLATGNALAPNKPNRIYVNNWHGGTRLANDSTYVRLRLPGFTPSAWFFANHEIDGRAAIPVFYELVDNQSDPAYEIIPQVSWDGGGTWEQMVDPDGDLIVLHNVPSSPNGQFNFFLWGALPQLLAHQGYELNPDQEIYVPDDAPDQEMDVAYRFYIKSNPEHGGYIQRPYFGTNTTLFRLDGRPDWGQSAKIFHPNLISDTAVLTNIVVPGELANFSIVVTQTDHGIPQGLITDNLPPQLTLEVTPTLQPIVGNLEWTTNTIEWTGGLDYGTVFDLNFDARVARPLPNGSEITNCADFFDGLHEPFERCVTVVVSSTPKLDESFKLVNGLTSNIAKPGERMAYTLVLTNTGTANATNMQLLDRLHPDLIFAGNLTATSGTAELVDDLISWQGDIDVFSPVTVTFDVSVTAPLPGNNLITNTFELVNGAGETVYTAVPVTTTVLAPDLRTSTKSVSPAEGIELGDTVTYQIVMTNTGAVSAAPAIFNDPLPGNSEYVVGSFTATSGTGDYNATTNQIEWQGTIAKDQVVTLSFQVRAYPDDDGSEELVNIAALSDAVGGDITLTATALFDLPNLGSASSKVAAQSIVELGDQVDYTVVIENRGGNAPLVVFDDPLPGSSTYVPGSFSSSDGAGGYDASSNSIVWQNGLANNESVTLDFSVTAGCPVEAGATLLTNTAVVNDGANDTTLQANTSLNLPRLFLSTQATPRQPLDGEIVTYRLLLENSGGIAPEAELLANVASNANIVGAPTATNGTVQYLPNTRQVRWSGELTSSENVEITFQAIVNGEPGTAVETTFNLNNTCSDQTVPANTVTIRPETVNVYLPLIAKP